MAVRFFPEITPGHVAQPHDRENLAEVIDLRSKLLLSVNNEQSARVDEDLQDISEYATKTLARKAMTSGELRAVLKENGYESSEIADVISTFRESLYLDDLGLARVLVEKMRSTKKMSRVQMRHKLAKRLLSPQVIDMALEDVSEESETELLYEVARKRAKTLQGLPQETAKRRLLGYLARRGWAGTEANRAVNEALSQGF